MSITKAETGPYSRMLADISQLIEFMNNGDAASKVELQRRLVIELENLRNLYHIVYGTDEADKALIENLSGLKPLSIGVFDEVKPRNDAVFLTSGNI